MNASSRRRRPGLGRLSLESLERRHMLTVSLTGEEQLLLELINRARSDPAGEAQRLLLDDLNQGLEPGELSAAPKPPLAPHPILIDAARRHAQDMLDRDYFEHVNPERKGPDQRARALGYKWGAGENIGVGGYAVGDNKEMAAAVEGLHARLFWSPGHRANLLWEVYRDVGPAVLFGEYTENGMYPPYTFNACMIVQNFGNGERSSWMDPKPGYLTGVAFSDTVVPDRFYSVGEGLADIVVTATGADGGRFSTTTGPSGAYVLPLFEGTYSVRFSRDGRAGPSVAVSIANDTNVKVDFDGVFTGPAPQSVPPTDIGLSASAIVENNKVGAVVGLLSTVDVDAGDTFTYALVAGDGSADNASFTIVGGELRAAAAFDFEKKSSHSIRVRSTDRDGLSTERSFTIGVTDVMEAFAVETVAAPLARSYRAGETIVVSLVLSGAATVTGKPTLPLVIGRTTRQARLTEGVGTNTLTFTHVVGAKDHAMQVAIGSRLTLPRGTAVTTADGRSLPDQLPLGVAGQVLPGVVIDTVAPRVAGRVTGPATKSFRTGDVLEFVVRFSEVVMVRGVPTITLTGFNGRPRQAAYVSGSGTASLTFRYVVQAGDAIESRKSLGLVKAIAVPADGSIADRAGNRSALGIAAPSLKGITISGASVSAS